LRNRSHHASEQLEQINVENTEDYGPGYVGEEEEPGALPKAMIKATGDAELLHGSRELFSPAGLIPSFDKAAIALERSRSIELADTLVEMRTQLTTVERELAKMQTKHEAIASSGIQHGAASEIANAADYDTQRIQQLTSMQRELLCKIKTLTAPSNISLEPGASNVTASGSSESVRVDIASNVIVKQPRGDVFDKEMALAKTEISDRLPSLTEEREQLSETIEELELEDDEPEKLYNLKQKQENLDKLHETLQTSQRKLDLIQAQYAALLQANKDIIKLDSSATPENNILIQKNNDKLVSLEDEILRTRATIREAEQFGKPIIHSQSKPEQPASDKSDTQNREDSSHDNKPKLK
jgi:hypothetical protein